MGIPVAETRGAATAPIAAVPRKSRREMLISPPPRSLSRFAYKVQDDTASVRPGTVLEHINALPCPERHPALLNRYRKLRQGQCRADVRRHVIRPFDRVAVQPVVLRHDP